MNPMQISDRLTLRRFGKVLTFASGIAFFLISLGSLVRAAQAGLSCPDWPLCFGELVPSFDTAVFLEWFHRLIAGLLGLLMAFVSVRIFSSPFLRRTLGTQIVAAMVLLCIQVVLGGLTVLKLLEAKTVSAHLLNALLFYAILLWMTFRVRNLTIDPTTIRAFRVPPSVKGLFAGVTAALFAQIALGGMVSSNFAGMVCPDFPKCHGEWLPPPLFPFVIQMLHRAAGFLVLFLVLALRVVCFRVSLPRAAALAVRVCPWLVVGQIGLGVVNVIYALPVAASAAHLANAVAIYTLLVLGTLSVFAASSSFAKTTTQESADGSIPFSVEGRLT